MKWSSHGLITGSVVYALTSSAIPAIVAAAGNTIPDEIEGKPGDDPDSPRYQRWRSRHRKGSHWFIPYLAVSIILFLTARHYGVNEISPNIILKFNVSTVNMSGLYSYAGAYLFLGAVLHILEDFLCGKVPSWNPKKRVGIKLFQVGSFTEYASVWALSGIILLWRVSS